jgi:sulfur-oxidizing protein SoxY
MRKRFVVLSFALLLGAAVSPVRAEVSEEDRAQRWSDLRHAIFGDRAVEDGGAAITLTAPARAMDAAIVPVAIALDGALAKEVKAVYLVIDDNPSPLAAVFHPGPAADMREISTRVRVDDYTYLHAVAETTDGRLLQTARFIKAAGGCSAPAGKDQALAMQRLGKMKLVLEGKRPPNEPAAAPVVAKLLISHPNNSGLQMDQLTRNYIPADFVQSVRITYDGKPVMTIDGDIAISEDPAFTFAFMPGAEPGELKAEIDDSRQRHFEQNWPVPPEAQM